MTIRIGWLSPLTPASGVGTFSHAVTSKLPASIDGEAIDLTLLYPDHAVLHRSPFRSIRIEDTDSFRNVLGLFDFLVYNIGNNTEHHEVIFRLLRTHPGIVVCHDYVYQHYLADRSMHNGRSFASFAALLMKFGDRDAGPYLARSRITSRLGKTRYSPWDSEVSASQPMSEAILDLGSALVVHSRFARTHVEKRFEGPILQLGMPHDQKPAKGPAGANEAWARGIAGKTTLNMVSFGHIQATKCTDLVLEALAASDALRRSVRYTIAGFVGDWDYLHRLEDFVASANLKNVVRFETGVSEARLAELMAGADLFVNLRKPNTEGSSASLIEQLDTGRPVVVLDSGCYGEVPFDAAVKLPLDAGIGEVRAALEQLVVRPELLPDIGRAGQAYARTWTCASYGERLVRFALEHRDLLRRRSALIGVGERLRDEVVEPSDEAWIAQLARARAAMRYLDRNVLMLDPELLMGLECDDLCTYVAQVILGIFDDARLHRALARYFVGRAGRELYWDCAQLALIVEAVFGADPCACERLKIVGPCFDPEFWDVIEAFPAQQYVATAALTILARHATGDEQALACEDEGCGRAKRQALREILKHSSSEGDPGLSRLKRWLEQPSEDLESDLPIIEIDLDCNVGEACFREHVDLSGFYPQEANLAWTRGSRGFIGLRLGLGVHRVESVVRSVNADPEHPATICLSCGTVAAQIVVRDGSEHALVLEIPRQLARPDAATWLQLSTTRAGVPVGTDDTRLLGACLLQLRFRVGRRDEAHALATQSV